MRITIRRITAAFLLPLAIALLLLTVAPQETFASSAHSPAGQEHWYGEGTYFATGPGYAPFLMELKISTTGQDFTGTYFSQTVNSEVDIKGNYSVGGAVGYGAFYFTSTNTEWGNTIVGCRYNADFTNPAQTYMKGSWVYPDGTSGGTFFLWKANN